MYNRILAIDFEGSHKNPRVGFPLQIGIALMEGLDVIHSWESDIRYPVHWKTGRPTRECDAFALEVSGFTMERIANAPPPSAVCLELFNKVMCWEAETPGLQVTSVPNVAFNMAYDIESYSDLLWFAGSFNWDYRQHMGFPGQLGSTWSCASDLARRRFPNEPDTKLDDFAAKFGLYRSTEKHGACEDAILAGRLYHHLTLQQAVRV